MGRIFLSHASEEHELVIHLANHLEKNNLRAWYAPRDIMGGIDYDKEIIAAIKDCRAFVLLLSRNSDASEDVKTEVYHAVKYHKQVICLDVDDVEPENLSYLLGMRHHLNWLERRDETLDKLIHDINCTSEHVEHVELAHTESVNEAPEHEQKAGSFKKILFAGIISVTLLSCLIFFMYSDRSEEISESAATVENSALTSNDTAVKRTNRNVKSSSVRGKCIVVNVPEDDVLNMRKRPTTRASVITGLNNGDVLEINSSYKRPGNSTLWYNVTDKRTGLTGFVSSKYIRRLKNTGAN